MPTPFAPRIILSQNARTDLQALARAHSTPQSLSLRARIILRAADITPPDQPTNWPQSRLYQPHRRQVATAFRDSGLVGLARCRALGATAHHCLPRACKSSR